MLSSYETGDQLHTKELTQGLAAGVVTRSRNDVKNASRMAYKGLFTFPLLSARSLLSFSIFSFALAETLLGLASAEAVLTSSVRDDLTLAEAFLGRFETLSGPLPYNGGGFITSSL